MEHTVTLLGYSLAWALLSSLPQTVLLLFCLYLVLKMFPGLSSPAKYTIAYVSLTGSFLWFLATWYARYADTNILTVSSAIQGSTTVHNAGMLQYSLPLHKRDIAGYGLLRALEQYFPYFIAIYFAGLVFFIARFVSGLYRSYQLTHTDINTTTQLQQFAGKWSSRLGINGMVRIYISGKVNVPVMIGAIRPVILLPLATVNHLSADQLEAIILHELAHIKRHDYLFNTVQVVIETILFFNPFIWAISAVIRREREHCCDDIVVAYTQPFSYARALAALEEQRHESAALALAATGNKNQLLNRIKRIMEMKNQTTHYNRPAIIVSALVAFAIVTALFTPSFAQKVKKTPSDVPAKSKPVNKQKEIIVREHGADDEEDAPGNGKSKVKVKVSIVDDGKGKGDKKVVRRVYSSDGDVLQEDLAKVSHDVAIAFADAKAQLDEVDWDEIKSEIKQALAEVDRTLSDKELHEKVRIEVKRGLDKAHRELEKASRELDRARADARASTHSSRTMVTTGGPANDDDVEDMLKEMDKEGLIDRDGKFKIEKRNGELYVNDEKQSQKVYDHYNQYVPAKNVAITGSKGGLNIAIQD